MNEYGSEAVASATMSVFPFDHVIITFPDAAAARAAELGPIRSLKQEPQSSFQNVRFTATADPLDARVGSGGGTAAALYDHSSLSTSVVDDRTPQLVPATRLNETVLILHAGGAASRCPTQMCLGKAWTSLPTLSSSSSCTTTSSDRRKSLFAERSLKTPLHLWLEICQRIFTGNGTKATKLPVGSVVVIASDTLLQLDGGELDDGILNKQFEKMDWNTTLNAENTILGLAVPAPLSTATNHGVFVVSDQSYSNDESQSAMHVAACCAVLQKPSMERMELTSNCCFSTPTTTSSLRENEADIRSSSSRCAWIDTGVTIFSPLAASMLYELARRHLQRCTATGLQAAYDQYRRNSHIVSQNSDEEVPTTSYSSVTEYAAQNAMSVDLYTHFLQALSLSQETVDVQMERRSTFIQQYSRDLPFDTITAIWDAFSSCTLQVLVLPHGRFWHLGTTLELHDFLVDACSTRIPDATWTNRQRQCQDFGSRLGLNRRLRAYTILGGNYDGSSCVDPSAVIYDSVVAVRQQNSTNSRSSVGARTVIEHCDVDIIDGTVCIGKNCLVSGLRIPSHLKYSGNVVIPDNMVVQMVQLNESKRLEGELSFVVIVLGINDEVKKSSTIYGRPIDKFLRWSGLSFSDLWDGPDSSRTVWTAKVHPIVTLSLNESFASVFSWLRQFDAESTSRGEGILQEETSLAKWKNCRRLSLSQIRDLSDAPYEFKFREELIIQRFPQIRTSFNEELVKMLLSRYHRTPIDFQFLVDGYVSNATVGQESSSISVGDLIEVFHALDDVIRECMNRDGRQDIGARASMLQCGLLDCLATALLPLNPNAPECSENITSQLSTIMSSLRETLERRKALTNKASDEFNALASVRDELIAAVLMSGIATVGEVMEELASVLTGMHVLAARGMHMSLQTQPPIYDRWIVATAPARIDLSGGWSDTPPICYEFGSLVVGVAVLIDDRKPLLCRCRILPGGTGILLRSESRNSVNGDQIAMLQTEIGNFDGLKDYHDPTSDCALLKCVLVHLGLLRTSSIDNENGDFQANLNGFCRSEGNSVRLEIIATTILPQGSGLGTSSILAGCILAAVGKCIGAGNLSSTEYASEIVDSVLNVEQYLTTGGGFQDQVNGLVGGIKAVSSLPKVYPMKISIENLAVTTNFQLELDNSIVLVFTGKTRLAKNLLKQVLLRWSKQTPEIFDAVSGLVGGAEKCHDAIKSGHLDMLGECLSQYWTYKKVMAGPSSGVEPQVVSDVITSLSMLGLVRGASLCGAGGGGFMVLLCAPGILLSDLQLALQNDPKLDQHSIASFTWHKCRICDEGLDVRQLDNSSGSIDDFDISWLTN